MTVRSLLFRLLSEKTPGQGAGGWALEPSEILPGRPGSSPLSGLSCADSGPGELREGAVVITGSRALTLGAPGLATVSCRRPRQRAVPSAHRLQAAFWPQSEASPALSSRRAEATRSLSLAVSTAFPHARRPPRLAGSAAGPFLPALSCRYHDFYHT